MGYFWERVGRWLGDCSRPAASHSASPPPAVRTAAGAGRCTGGGERAQRTAHSGHRGATRTGGHGRGRRGGWHNGQHGNEQHRASVSASKRERELWCGTRKNQQVEGGLGRAQWGLARRPTCRGCAWAPYACRHAGMGDGAAPARGFGAVSNQLRDGRRMGCSGAAM